MMADINSQKLSQAANSIRNKFPELSIETIICNVANEAEMKLATEKTLDCFGKVHILINNAGVAFGGKTGEIPLDDWRWIININLMGVVYGVEMFTPLILSHGEGGHIINTASMAGHWTIKKTAPYNTTKFAVVGYTETLRKELAHSNIGVSVLCPGWVSTGIFNSELQRPSQKGNKKSSWTEDDKKIFNNAMKPNVIGELVCDSIIDNRLYIFTHPEMKSVIPIRYANIMRDYKNCTKHPLIKSSHTKINKLFVLFQPILRFFLPKIK